ARVLALPGARRSGDPRISYLLPGTARSSGSLTPPRENVLLVPNRNVLLTKSGWGGERTRSSPYDPAGQRPAGSAAESREEADWTGAGRQGTGDHGAADPAIIAAAEKRRRQSGH